VVQSASTLTSTWQESVVNLQVGEVRLRPRARADLDKIWDYTLERWGVDQAESYTRALAHAFDLLADQPHLGRAWTDVHEGLRMFPAGKHLVLYFADDNGIDVVRVLHERMSIDDHLVSN